MHGSILVGILSIAAVADYPRFSFQRQAGDWTISGNLDKCTMQRTSTVGPLLKIEYRPESLGGKEMPIYEAGYTIEMEDVPSAVESFYWGPGFTARYYSGPSRFIEAPARRGRAYKREAGIFQSAKYDPQLDQGVTSISLYRGNERAVDFPLDATVAPAFQQLRACIKALTPRAAQAMKWEAEDRIQRARQQAVRMGGD